MGTVLTTLLYAIDRIGERLGNVGVRLSEVEGTIPKVGHDFMRVLINYCIKVTGQ